MTPTRFPLKGVLFDLDGTLLDTSLDFTYALNQICAKFDQPRIRYQDLRKTVSQGGTAMVQQAFPNLTGEALEQRRQEFLDLYFEHIDRHTRLFPGLEGGMEHLASKQIPWGIVTNKPTWLTEKLLSIVHFPSRPLTVICGDTLKVRKPHAEPMLLAAQQCGLPSQNCLYLGDHPRDIEAGINAKMATGVAYYGYLPENADASAWPADFEFHTPYEISQFIQSTF
ncbi:MAG: HAD-IA family hydrolase [Thiotrichales bacterium]|nr:HAD-IA family hydrolase [Thiotrichales bacterium]